MFFYALALKFPMFLQSEAPITGNADGFLYDKLLQGLQSFETRHASAFLGFFLIYFQAVALNRLCNRFKLMQRPNYLTGMSYLLISSLFSEWFVLSSAMVANTFFIWIMYGLAGIYNSQHVKSTIFNLGVILGIATFFYYPAALFIVLIFAGLVFSRPFRLAEWFMVILGFISPVYFLISILFLGNRLQLPAMPLLDFSIPPIAHAPWAIASIILVVITTLAGVYFVIQNMRRQIVHTRKTWNLLFFYCFIALIIPFFNHSNKFHYWILGVIPFALIAGSAFLYPEKRWFRLVIHLYMMILALVMGYYFG